MQVQIEFLDVTPFLNKGQRPAILVKAPRNEIWYTPATPVLPSHDNPTPQWSFTRGGETRIELFPYLLDVTEPHLSLQGVWELVASISTHTPHTRQFVVIGVPFIPKNEGNHAQVWLGMALINTR